MHCNLRPLDAAPIILRYNEDTTKFEVGQPNCLFNADTLWQVATLTFDPGVVKT